MVTSNKFYSKQGLWTLFLMSAFPLHVWTIINALQDFSWVSQRTNSWDAIGVVSYGLLFTLIESLFVFIIVTTLGFLVSAKWDETQRITTLTAVIFISSLWGMFTNLYFLLAIEPSEQFIVFFVNTERPLRMLYILALILTTISFLLPIYFLLSKKGLQDVFMGIIDRLSTLTWLYLFLDLIAIIIIIIRNI